MKPYSPKRKGSTRGSVSCTSNCPTRQRAIRQDKKAARREGTKLIGGARSAKIGSWMGGPNLDEYSSSAGYGGWGHDE